MSEIPAAWLVIDTVTMGRPVELSDGSQFPASVTVVGIVVGLSFNVGIVVEDGRPIFNDILIERGDDLEGPLTAAAIRDFPVDEVVQASIAAVHQYIRNPKRPDRFGSVPRPRRITPDLLREVAAVVKGDDYGEPNKAVVRRFNVSPRTASRWIKAAEEATKGA